MKRRRRPNPTPWLNQIREANPYGGKAIPPLSVVRLKSEWEGTPAGSVFRIGYYGRRDGKNWVWLVDAAGSYSQSTDQKSISEEFEVLKLSDETDFYGDERDVLGPVTQEELLQGV